MEQLVYDIVSRSVQLIGSFAEGAREYCTGETTEFHI